jgi:hypothetical protein
MDKYRDPRDAIEIVEKLKTLPTIKDVKLFADNIFPGWFISSINEYSSDYPHLTDNWNTVCSLIKCKRAQIIIVDDIIDDQDHTIVKMFAECFTLSGFNVRIKKEYFECSNCGRAIPSFKLWKSFKEKRLNIPEKWSTTCTNCL